MRENLPRPARPSLLMQKDNITLLCHRRPDGDTVGSAFALYYALREPGQGGAGAVRRCPAEAV